MIHWVVERINHESTTVVRGPYTKKDVAEKYLEKLRRRYPFFRYRLTELEVLSPKMARLILNGN